MRPKLWLFSSFWPFSQIKRIPIMNRNNKIFIKHSILVSENLFRHFFSNAAFLNLVSVFNWLILFWFACVCLQSKSLGFRIRAMNWSVNHACQVPDRASHIPKFDNVAVIDYLPKDVSIFVYLLNYKRFIQILSIPEKKNL